MVHTLDVDGMLASLTHEQWAEWQAYDRIEPIGNQPLCEVLSHVGMAVMAGRGAEPDIKCFMPWAEEVKPQAASPQQVESFLRKVAGGT